MKENIEIIEIIVEIEIGNLVESVNMEEIKIVVVWKEVEKGVWIETQINKIRVEILIGKLEGKISMLKEVGDCREILKEEVWKEVRIGGIQGFLIFIKRDRIRMIQIFCMEILENFREIDKIKEI